MFCKIILMILLAICAQLGHATPIMLEIATVIPDGTDAAQNLKQFANSIASATSNEIKMRYQWGGLAGDDKQVLSLIKEGKLAGALFAGQVLSEIAPEIRESEKLFQFGSDRKKAWNFVEKNQSAWKKSLEKKQLHSLGFYEAGFVYLVSRKPFHGLSDLKGAKIWSWPEDRVIHKTISALGGVAQDVPVQDTLKALSDGKIDMAYAPPIVIVALQWQSKITHMAEQPIAFAAGTFVLSDSTWKSLPNAARKAFDTESGKALTALSDSTAKDNQDAFELLKGSAIKLVKLSDADILRVRGK